MKTAHTTEQAMVTLQLSLTLEADYRNRAAFSGLRLEKADHRNASALFFNVPVDFAREVLEDAREQMKLLTNHRGVYRSYHSLAGRLKRDLDEAEGVRPDPGLEKWKEDMEQLGCHRVEAVLYAMDGEPAEIVRGYGIHKVTDPDGEYRDGKDGKRFSYRPGYVVLKGKGLNVQRLFYPAGDLVDKEGSPTHLSLVHSA